MDPVNTNINYRDNRYSFGSATCPADNDSDVENDNDEDD